LFLMSLACLFGGWTLTDLELYDTLLPINTAVDDGGHFFVADAQSATIHRISSEGQHLTSFGGRGQGPGELFSISCLQIKDRVLYVYDQVSKKMLAFALDGSLLAHYRTPSTPLNGWSHPLFKTDKGWLVLGYKVIRLMGDSFEEAGVFLGSLEEDRAFRTRDRRVYTPSPDTFLFTVDQVNGRVIVYVPGDGFRMRVFSLETLAQVHTLQIPGDLVPFDKDYGQARFERFKSRNAQRPWFREDMVLDLPEYFKPFTSLWALPTGELQIVLGNPLLADTRRNRYLGKALAPIETPSHRNGKTLILNSHENDVFICYPDDRGALVLERIAAAECHAPTFARP